MTKEDRFEREEALFVAQEIAAFLRDACMVATGPTRKVKWGVFETPVKDNNGPQTLDTILCQNGTVRFELYCKG